MTSLLHKYPVCGFEKERIRAVKVARRSFILEKTPPALPPSLLILLLLLLVVHQPKAEALFSDGGILLDVTN